MKDLNFVKNRWRIKQLSYLGVDLIFIILIAFTLMLCLRVFFYRISQENNRVESYLQSQIVKLSSKASGYSTVKKQRNKFLDISSDLTNIKASRYLVLIAIENISQAITSGLYITNVNYSANSDMILLRGETEDLKLLPTFTKSLGVKFGIKGVKIRNLGPEKSDGHRSFYLELKLGEKK